jgi:hypothetical protein
MIFCIINNIHCNYLILKELQNKRSSNPSFVIITSLLSMTYNSFLVNPYQNHRHFTVYTKYGILNLNNNT